MNYPQTPQKPPQTFGGIQQNFAYNMRNFRMNDQFTIVEDLPSNKPIRQIMKMSLKPNARTGKPEPYMVFAIRISSNGFEADLELFDTELNTLAIACPKDIKNFKGTTLAYDGLKWHYICGDMPAVGTSPTTQPYQPPQVDQKVLFINQMVDGIKALNMVGQNVDPSMLTKLCDKISPGNALEMIASAKTQGRIYEQGGVYKIVE
jgi:hypothetical protein